MVEVLFGAAFPPEVLMILNAVKYHQILRATWKVSDWQQLPLSQLHCQHSNTWIENNNGTLSVRGRPPQIPDLKIIEAA